VIDLAVDFWEANVSFFLRRLAFRAPSHEERPEAWVQVLAELDLRFLDPPGFFVATADCRDLVLSDATDLDPDGRDVALEDLEVDEELRLLFGIPRLFF
jgi:hypothetical protein